MQETAHGIVVVKLNLDAEQKTLLDAVGWRCTRIRNAMIMDWYARQLGMPKSAKQAAANNGQAAETTLLYHAGMEFDERLAAKDGLRAGSTAISCISRSISSYLSGRMPWRKEYMTPENQDPPRKRAEAIMQGVIRPPFFSGPVIPIHNRSMEVKISDSYYVTIVQGPVKMTAKLGTRDLSAGQRRALLRFARGADRLPCAELIRQDSRWMLRLPVARRVDTIPGARWLAIKPACYNSGEEARKGWPMLAEGPDECSAHVGYGHEYWRRMVSLAMALKIIGIKYRKGCKLGKGRRKYRQRSIQIGAARRGAAREFRHDLVRRIMHLARKWCCRNIEYFEPSVPLRTKCWASLMGVDWDWTAFRVDLQNACAKRGLALHVKQLKWKDVFGESASNDQENGENGKQRKRRRGRAAEKETARQQ